METSISTLSALARKGNQTTDDLLSLFFLSSLTLPSPSLSLPSPGLDPPALLGPLSLPYTPSRRSLRSLRSPGHVHRSSAGIYTVQDQLGLNGPIKPDWAFSVQNRGIRAEKGIAWSLEGSLVDVVWRKDQWPFPSRGLVWFATTAFLLFGLVMRVCWGVDPRSLRIIVPASRYAP